MNPVDRLIKKLRDDHQVFSIILEDMKVEGSFFNKYYHRYKVLTSTGENVDKATTDWMEVKEKFFWEHERNLGMTLASRTEDGALHKEAAPPGFYNYVGDSRYGRFEQRNGQSFWVFFGQYMFLRSMLNLGGVDVFDDDYRKWKRNYRGRKPYYGSASGRYKSRYGTYSAYNRKSRPDFFERRRRSSGWSKSQYTTTGDKRRSRGTFGSGVRRSNGRYSSGSGGFRSRGGGFGK